MIFWIASYPKSGNTWIRALISTYLYTDGKEFNFDLLLNIPKFTQEKYISPLIKLEKIKKNPLEITKHWENAQSRINLDNKLKFFKTHNAMCAIDGNAFTNNKNTIGAIYIVRDPRDIVVSASKYFNTSHEKTKNNMFNIYMDLINTYNDKPINTFLGSWSVHYNSWIKNSKNILLIKYENLINNKELEIRRVINFINKFTKFSVDEEKIKKCIISSSFENMKNMENKGLFKESAKDSKGNNIPFFNHGKIGMWKNILKKEIVSEIEKKFYKEMRELNYLS